MPLSNPLVVAVIGAGHWGPNVIRNFSNHPRVILKYVCDTDSKKLDKISNILQVGCQFLTDASTIIKDADVEAIAVVTPASTHYNLVKEALLAKKHVFCEKPMTLDVREGEELCTLAETSGVKFMVGYTFLYNNGVRYLKKIGRSKSLGKLYYMTSTRTHMGLIREDVDAAWDLASHDISIMNYILDETPVAVSSIGASPLGNKHHDVAFITLHYKNDIIGQIHVSWVDSNKERKVSLIGSKARVEFDDLNDLEPIRIYEKGVSSTATVSIEAEYGNFRFLLRDGDIISPKIEMSEPLYQMIDSFVCNVLDNTEIVTDGRFALEITKTLISIQHSFQSKSIQQIL